MKQTGILPIMFAMLMAAGWVSTEAQDLPSVISQRGWADTGESRRAQAAEWLGEVSKIDRQIPTLSPAEEAWLKVEYDDEVAREGHLTTRAVRALNSREGLIRFTKPVTKSLVSVFEQLASNTKLNQQAEAMLWGRLAYLVLDQNFWGNIASLGELGVLARNPKSKTGTDGSPGYSEELRFIWAARAQDILGNVVLPTLESAPR